MYYILIPSLICINRGCKWIILRHKLPFDCTVPLYSQLLHVHGEKLRVVLDSPHLQILKCTWYFCLGIMLELSHSKYSPFSHQSCLHDHHHYFLLLPL